MIWSIILAVLFFGIIILVHEMGHFFAARIFGVTVDEFSIGMGPELFSKQSEKSRTRYSLRALPIGGFVSMAGEDEHSDSPRALCNRPKYQRFIILFAGAFMNLVLGFLIMLVCVSFSEKLYSNEISSFLVVDENENVVTNYQGLEVGDELVAINGSKLNVRYDYLFSAMRMQDKPCSITVNRNGEKLTIENFVFPTTTENGIVYGNPSFFVPAAKDKTVLTVLHDTAGQTVSSVKMVIFSIYDLVTGKYSADAVSGPVGVVSEIHETASYGILPTLFLISLITINIGVFNLLPFPALDGGRIVFLAIEAIIRRPLNRKTESFINFMGLVILFGLMIIITFKDIISLF